MQKYLYVTVTISVTAMVMPIGKLITFTLAKCKPQVKSFRLYNVIVVAEN